MKDLQICFVYILGTVLIVSAYYLTWSYSPVKLRKDLDFLKQKIQFLELDMQPQKGNVRVVVV